MKPYLQASTLDGIYVMVECDSKDTVVVTYGEIGGKSAKTANTSFYRTTDNRKKTYVHRVPLRDLKPDTKYYYSVSQGGTPTEAITFHSAVEPGSYFKFAYYGDTRSNPDMHSVVVKEILKHNPYFSIAGGDLCYNSGYSSWKSEFFIPSELELDSRTPFFNTIGNHEDWSQNTKAFQQAPISPSGKQEYYSFDYGDAHFVIISTEHEVSKGSAQWEFVKEDLKNTKKPWKIAAFHKPAYCSGGMHGGNTDMQIMTKELFEPAGVNIVMASHNHYYQHNLVNGIHHLVMAGAGAPFYTPMPADFVVKSVKEKYHFAIFDVSSDKIKMNVYDIYGNVLDTLELKK